MFDLKVRGLDRVQNGLRLLASEMPELIDDEMGDWAQDMRATLKSTAYPPKPPASTYTRTGRLANSWAAKQQRPGLWSIINRARSPRGQEYAFRVVGDAKGGGVAWMHKGRWWLAIDVIKANTAELTRRLTTNIVRYWEKNG